MPTSTYSDDIYPPGKAPYCHTAGKCFAKRESVKKNGAVCVILTDTYKFGKPCPFMKEKKDD